MRLLRTGSLPLLHPRAAARARRGADPPVRCPDPGGRAAGGGDEEEAMTITAAIKQLELLRTRAGDVQVCADCPYCSRSFEVTVVVTGSVVASLRALPEPPRV